MDAENVLPFAPATEAGFGPGTRLRGFDLTAPGLPRRRFGGVSGRFATMGAMAQEAVAAQDATLDPPDTRSQRLRIVRRPTERAASSHEVFSGEPMRAMPPQGARYIPASDVPVRRGRAVAMAASERRSGFWLAVILMIGVWAGVVAMGAFFFNTPRSGFKVEWR